jgi:cholesterol 7-dehydrogenase
MLDTLDLGQLPNIFTYYVLPVFVIGGYIFYYRKFAFYQLYDTYVERGFNSKLPRGKTPPAYPNGWYRLCRSNELKSR